MSSAGTLTLDGVSKRFGGTLAVDNVSFVARPGRIHALLGENGAGKSTLMRMAFGMVAPDSGRISMGGVEQRFGSAADAIHAGIGMVHQHFTNVPAMTVAENVALGHRGAFDRAQAEERVRDIGRRTGLVLDPAALVSDLAVGGQQRLEIVKALGRSARVLILDEPTAVLAPREADDLLQWLREFANAGSAVVVITHKLREALTVADEVTVMRRGRSVLEAVPARELAADTLAVAIVGERIDRTVSAHAETQPAGHVVARLNAVSALDDRGAQTLSRVSLEVRAGEILGIAAVEGAGQRDVLRLLAGRTEPTSGAVERPSGIGFIPEDRHADALILDFSQTENLILRGSGSRRGRIDWSAAVATTDRLAAEFDVRGGAPAVAVGTLSGGNQQKLVLARELNETPVLVVVENPTRGLDIRATDAVHRRLRSAADEGAAVVVYSSDLDEVMSLASRIVVMHGGVAREVARDRERVGRAMLGVA